MTPAELLHTDAARYATNRKIAYVEAVLETEKIADWKNRNPMNRSPSTEIICVKVCVEEIT